MRKEQGRAGRSFMTALAIAAALVALAGTARAELITPTAAYVSTQNGVDRGAVGTINNSNLSGPPYDLDSTHEYGEAGNNMWQTLANNGIGGQWIAFNLGGAYNLTQANVWNYRDSFDQNRSMRNIDVYVSSLETPVLPTYATVAGVTITQGQTITDANLLALGGGDDWTRVTDNHELLRVASGTNPEPVQTFDLAANNVQWVIIRADETNGNYGGNRTGLFEVKFTGSVIPEPATLSMLGVVGIAMLLRRKIRG